MGLASLQIVVNFVLIVASAVLNMAGWQRTIFHMLSGYLLIAGILRMFGVRPL